jgi:hypothetical protein
MDILVESICVLANSALLHVSLVELIKDKSPPEMTSLSQDAAGGPSVQFQGHQGAQFSTTKPLLRKARTSVHRKPIKQISSSFAQLI